MLLASRLSPLPNKEKNQSQGRSWQSTVRKDKMILMKKPKSSDLFSTGITSFLVSSSTTRMDLLTTLCRPILLETEIPLACERYIRHYHPLCAFIIVFTCSPPIAAIILGLLMPRQRHSFIPFPPSLRHLLSRDGWSAKTEIKTH